MHSLGHYIREYPGVLGPEVCAELIDIFEQSACYHQHIGCSDPRSPRFTQLRLSDLFDPSSRDPIQRRAAATWRGREASLQAAVKGAIRTYLRDVQLDSRHWPKTYGFEHFRIKRYQASESEQFPNHVDVGDYASARRFLVALFYLNSTDGGATQFEGGSSVQPETGKLLIFPPLWMFPHSGDPLNSGSKYICGTYLHYL